MIGHRSPDTDSVCSAIAYAHPKNCLGHPTVRPARAGEIDTETKSVLRYFDVPVPELLTDAVGLELILLDHNELARVILMASDAQAEASDLWVVGGRLDLFERAFGTAENGVVHLPGCMSGRKQVVPRLEAVFAAAEGQDRDE